MPTLGDTTHTDTQMILKDYPNYKITQTSLKDLEKDSTCPTRWKAQWLDRVIPFASNENMDKGKYFEWIGLGGGAIGVEDDVTDLPRTSTGKKTIEQIRIEEQAARFKRLFDPNDPEFLGFDIVDRQVNIVDEVNNSTGTIDFVLQDRSDKSIMITDLKLTKDATSTRSEYGWGNNWREMDMLQLIHYSDLYASKYGIVPRTALMVFDYSPDKLIKFGEIIISNKARKNKDIRIATGWDVINLYSTNGWITIPSKYECAACPLNCPDRNKESQIERFTINI